MDKFSRTVKLIDATALKQHIMKTYLPSDNLTAGVLYDLLSVAPPKEITDGKMFSGWISVDDRLPEIIEGRCMSDKVLILIGVKNKQYDFGWYKALGYQHGKPEKYVWVLDDNNPFPKQELITHWMPLPELPKEEDHE